MHLWNSKQLFRNLSRPQIRRLMNSNFDDSATNETISANFIDSSRGFEIVISRNWGPQQKVDDSALSIRQGFVQFGHHQLEIWLKQTNILNLKFGCGGVFACQTEQGTFSVSHHFLHFRSRPSRGCAYTLQTMWFRSCPAPHDWRWCKKVATVKSQQMRGVLYLCASVSPASITANECSGTGLERY